MGNKISKIYVGTNQVRPSGGGGVREYSYDFRNKNSTEITNAGFTVFGDIITSPNGWTCRVGVDISLLYSVDLSSAKKITINSSILYNADLYGWATIFGIQKEYEKYPSNQVIFYLASITQYGGSRAQLVLSGTTAQGTNMGGIGQSSYTPQLEIDLVNKTITCSVSGYSNSTLSLSEAQVSLIREMGYLSLYTTQNTFYIQDVSIQVEN